MVNDTAARPQVIGRLARRLRAVAANQRLIVGSAVLSLLASALFGASWISLLRVYWRGTFACSAWIRWSSGQRAALSIIAVAAGLVLVAVLVRVGRDKSRLTTRQLVTYWGASLTLWTVLALMATTGVSRNMCLRGIAL